MGVFISFEGGEGAGKSTQIAALSRRLRDIGRTVVVTREPGGSPRAEALRLILLAGHAKRLGPFAETLLFAAARAHHVDHVIRPALARSHVVLCDRFTDSTHVYQGTVAGLPDAMLLALDGAAAREVRPDLTVVLDVPAALGLARARARRDGTGEDADRFEAEAAGFHEAVRAGFLRRAARDPGRYAVVDGTRNVERVAGEVWTAVASRFGEGRARG